MTGRTVAGVRATLVGGAQVLEQVGWAQGRAISLDGRVCAREALRIAADGDDEAMVHALEAVDGMLLPLRIDLVTWNDRADRRYVDAVTLLRSAADRVAA